MKYESAAAFRQALEQRLLARTRDAGLSLVRLRKGVVFDRLLARLAVAAPRRWVLKGALALDFRLGERTRTTKDMDLVRRDDEESATADLIAARGVDLDDFFVFSIAGRARLREQDGGTVEFRVRAELAGRLFEEVLLDIGFSDPLRWEPELIRGSDVLAFAGIDPIEVPALPLEQQVAEKVHAYSRTYGGHTSSRVKDLVDLVLVKQLMVLDAGRLRDCACRHLRGSEPARLARPPPTSAGRLGRAVPKARSRGGHRDGRWRWTRGRRSAAGPGARRSG